MINSDEIQGKNSEKRLRRTEEEWKEQAAAEWNLQGKKELFVGLFPSLHHSRLFGTLTLLSLKWAHASYLGLTR